MRYTTLAAAALIGLSTAAIAQVASTPVEQKGAVQAGANTSDDAPPANGAAASDDAAPAQTTTEALANVTPAAGDPAATGKPPK